MGRHGGGSSRGGGGGSGGRSGGGSSRGGRRSAFSSTPRPGYHNRSYYDRHGRYHSFYCADPYYGTQPYSIGNIITLVFVTVHMLAMLASVVMDTCHFGARINGDPSLIAVYDQAEIMSDREEQQVLRLFNRVYEKSGMPVFLVTSTFQWRDRYDSIEACSESYYYSQTLSESAMVVFFAVDSTRDYIDWEFDIYCGEDTVRCLSDASFDELVDLLQRSAYANTLCDSLQYSFNEIIPSMATVSIIPSYYTFLVVVPLLLFVYGSFYVALIRSMRRQHDMYHYYKTNPGVWNGTTEGTPEYHEPKRVTYLNGKPYNE